MTIQILEAKRRDIRSQARAKTREMTDDVSEKQAREIEAQFNELMLEYDDLSDQIEEQRSRGDGSEPTIIDGRKRPVGENKIVRGDGREVLREIAVDHLEPNQRMADWSKGQGNESEFEELGAGQYLRSMVLGAQSDLEKRALAEGTDSAGGYTVPEPVAMELIDLLRAQSVAINAGARTIPLTSDSNAIAKLASDAVPAWRAENAAIAESDPTFDRVLLQPKSLAVLVKASRELIEDTVNIGTELPRVLAEAMAKEWDRVALMGSGTGNEPTGIENTSGIGTNALGAALTSYAPLITARTAIKTANAEPTAFVMHPRDEGTFAGLTATDNQPLVPPRQVTEVPWLTTTSIPTDEGVGSDESMLFAGDFRHLYLGVRTQIRVEILRELYAENHQYGFVAHMRGDIGVAHPSAFHVTTGVQG